MHIESVRLNSKQSTKACRVKTPPNKSHICSRWYQCSRGGERCFKKNHLHSINDDNSTESHCSGTNSLRQQSEIILFFHGSTLLYCKAFYSLVHFSSAMLYNSRWRTSFKVKGWQGIKTNANTKEGEQACSRTINRQYNNRNTTRQ